MWIIIGGLIVAVPAVAIIAYVMCFVHTDRCWHDWEVVVHKRQSDLHAEINNKVRPLPLPSLAMGCSYAHEPWFETRVCLKCHAIDDQIARETQRYMRELVDKEDRKARAETVLANATKG